MSDFSGGSGSAFIVEVSIENFQAEVAEKSQSTPVLLEFYAEESEPSRQLSPVLMRLANEYAGKFILGRVEIRANQQLVQQLGVRTLPTVKIIFQGQMVQNLEGPVEESQLRAYLDEITMSPLDRVRAQIDEMVAQGNRTAAIAMLQQVVQEEPKNHGLQVELADLLTMEGQIDQAQQVLAGLPADAEGISKPKNRISFLEDAGSLPGIEALTGSISNDENNLTLRYQLAVCLVADDQIEQALEQLLVVMQKDREFEDEVARKTMIRIFELLGKGNELATSYRRKMFALLH